ncbi:TetR/AcrR family transcriptional regulator [Kocuria palustris]|uniref:TetR/AcrR family transcriptional regulator n=1 Tax=Kocuria palustris TaxID=71999 RepID=UPI0035E0B6D9
MNENAGRRPGSPGRPVNAELTPVIMDSVLSLLAEDGYAQLTTAAVAKRAGVSTATLYRRWPSKRDLLLAAAGQLAEAETGDVDTGTVEADLRALFSHKRAMLAGRIGATLVALAGESAHDPELAAIMRTSVFDPTRDHLERILERAAARGEQATADAVSAAHLVVGVILARIAFADAEDAGLLPESDVTMLLHAITGDSGRPCSLDETRRR